MFNCKVSRIDWENGKDVWKFYACFFFLHAESQKWVDFFRRLLLRVHNWGFLLFFNMQTAAGWQEMILTSSTYIECNLIWLKVRLSRLECATVLFSKASNQLGSLEGSPSWVLPGKYTVMVANLNRWQFSERLRWRAVDKRVKFFGFFNDLLSIFCRNFQFLLFFEGNYLENNLLDENIGNQFTRTN